ncbi:response regulator, partial [Campylobacter fetus subsp. venerealis]
ELSSGQAEKEEPSNIAEPLVDQMKTVLIVDDNLQIRNYLSSILNDCFNVVETDSAEDARQILKRQLPDLIISDVIMEGETGVEF